MQSSQLFIGSCKACPSTCSSKNKQEFQAKPHQDIHQILTQKQFNKKFNKSIIPNVVNKWEQYSELITNQVGILISKIKEYQEKTLMTIKKLLFSSIIFDKLQLNDDILETFIKLNNLQYEDLSCHQLHTAFAVVDKNIKQISPQQQIQKLIKNLKNQIQKGLQDSFKTILKKQSNVSTNSTKTYQKLKKAQSYQESEVHNFYSITNQDSQNDRFSLDDSLSLSIDFQPSRATTNNFSQIQQQKITKDNKFNQTFIQQLKQMQIFFEQNAKDNMKKRQYKKQQMKQQNNKLTATNKDHSVKKKIQIIQFDLDSAKDIKTQDKKNQLEQKNIKKKISQQTSSKSSDQAQKIEKKESQQKKQKVSQIKDIASSYVKKQEGKYYIRVAHLQKKQYRQNKATFNIKLRVLQLIIFRLFHDSKSNKIFKKVKFIAGDQTGIIICYTNFLPQIKKGTYIVLNQCQLQKYRDVSFQISCHKCKISQQKQTFNINAKKSISRFRILEPFLIYQMQKYDPKWPSIIGLLDKKNKKGQIIAKIQQIIQENEQFIFCFLSDGTGKIYTTITKTQQSPKYLLGKSYFFKNVEPVQQKVYSNQIAIYLQISQKNKSIIIQDMIYDQMQVRNVNQFVQK